MAHEKRLAFFCLQYSVSVNAQMCVYYAQNFHLTPWKKISASKWRTVFLPVMAVNLYTMPTFCSQLYRAEILQIHCMTHRHSSDFYFRFTLMKLTHKRIIPLASWQIIVPLPKAEILDRNSKVVLKCGQ